MGKAVDELLTALTDKEEILEALLHLLEEERASVVQLDLTELDRQGERKGDLYARLERSSAHCRALMARLAADTGGDAGRLSALVAAVGEGEREELERVRQRLLELGGRLQELSQSNRALLEGALATVNRSLEFFGRMFNRSNTYGEAGRMVGGAPRPRIFCREA